MADVPARPNAVARFEGVDAFGVLAVAYSGELETRGDHDWVRLEVVAGRAYQIVLDGTIAGTPFAGPFASIRDANGDVIVGSSETRLEFTATTTGSVYIDVNDGGRNAPGGSTYDIMVLSPARQVEFVPGTGQTYTGASGALVIGSGVDDSIIVGANGVAYGRSGADFIQLSSGGAAHGGAGDDSFFGSNIPDVLFGGWGDDLLSGGDGNDKLFGGPGGDFLAGGADGDSLTGGAGGDILNGDDGADTLDGGAGEDNLDGGAGDDLIHVDGDGDLVIEAAGGGFDRVSASVTYALGAAAEVEVLQAAGASATTAIRLTGNAFSQAITGNDGANTLSGGGGDDTLTGNGGADSLVGGGGVDLAAYGSAPGRVVVNLSTPSQNTGDAKGDRYSAIEGVSGTALNDALTGDAKGNILFGQGGDDTLDGLAGKDTLIGGLGDDIFRFTTAPANSNRDAIRDFRAADDTFHLENAAFVGIGAAGRLKASAFKDLSEGAVDANDRILFDPDTGELFYDRDGSGSAFGRVNFASLNLDLGGAATPSAADFVIV